MKIDGRKIADGILNNLKKEVNELKEQGIVPRLTIITLGEDPASTSYISQKELRADEVGCKVTVKKLNSNVSNKELLDVITSYNADKSIHGIIVQRPVPPQIDNNQLDLAIDLTKDVDGFHPESQFESPIAEAVIEILQSADTKVVNNFMNQKIVVIGKGITGGIPVTRMLRKLGTKPHLIDSKTENPEDITKNADIIISAVGKAHIIKNENIKKGVILISIGMHKEADGKFHGDYEESEIEEKAAFYTPTPGGVGPVNVACLLKNLVEAAING